MDRVKQTMLILRCLLYGLFSSSATCTEQNWHFDRCQKPSVLLALASNSKKSVHVKKNYCSFTAVVQQLWIHNKNWLGTKHWALWIKIEANSS